MTRKLQRCIVALPVDGRPAVRSQAQALAAAAGWRLVMPEVAALGHFRQAADRDALAQWVLDNGDAADGFVLSIDLLVYGGLVPSRFIEDPLPALQARLALIEQLHARWPDKPVYAFAATMRLSNNDIADEEKAYWAEHGCDLWAWSFHSDRAEQTGATDSAALAEQAQSRIPVAVRADYLATRARNFAVTRGLLLTVAEGRLQRLVLPQDDTATYGLNVAEKRQLEAEVLHLGLNERVAIYAGADEVLHTLCAHQVQRLTASAPLRVALLCSDPVHVERLVPLYEDRPVLHNLAQQLLAVGAVQAPDDSAADWLLALHSQGTAQGDWAMQKPPPQRVPVAPTWFTTIQQWHTNGRPVALADLAFANGGDPWLLAHPALQLSALAAYAGWNTAGNSLGSVLAHAAWLHAAGVDPQSAPARRITALRLLEDGLYQAQLRQVLRGCVDEAQADATTLLRYAHDLVVPACQAFARHHGLPAEVRQVALPWGRSFEIDLQPELPPDPRPGPPA